MGVVFRCSGDVVAADFLAANNGFLATPEEIKKWRYGLVDLSGVRSMDIGYLDVSRIVAQNSTIASIAVPGVLIAVAAPGDHGFGLARMWEALVERVGWETMTFRSLAEAEDWIQRRVKEKFEIDLATPA